MEALVQIKLWKLDSGIEPVFTFRNVNISAALVVHEQVQDLELFTMVYPQKISTASTSDNWYDFSISSFENGSSVSHCVGSISVSVLPINLCGTVVDAIDYDKWSMTRWYAKLAQEGLCFGRTFQSLTSMKTEKARLKSEALSTTKLFQRAPKSTKHIGTPYAIHPVVVDACLQAAIMGSTAGELRKLRAFLPTFIGHLQISTPPPQLVGSEVFIHSQSQDTGFSTKKINVTLRDSLGNPLVNFTNTKLSLYAGAIEEGLEPSEANRHPTLRVIWKPDITRLDECHRWEVDAYLEQYLSNHHTLLENLRLGVMTGLVDLAGHKNPRIRVLELSRDCRCNSSQFLETLDSNTEFPRSRTWHSGNLVSNELVISSAGNPDKSEKIRIDDSALQTYDLVIMPKVSLQRQQTREYTDLHQNPWTSQQWSKLGDDLKRILSPQGIIIGKTSAANGEYLKSSGFKILNLIGDVMIAIAHQKVPILKDKEIVLVSTRSFCQRPGPLIIL